MLKKNMILNGLLAILAVFTINCQSTNSSVSLKTTQPEVLETKGTEIFQFWEFPNDTSLWNTSFFLPLSIELYKDSVSKILGKDKFILISSERALQDSSYKSVITKNGDSINAQLVHSKTIGKIRSINYLEAQLLDYQISRYPLFSHPTEFHGFILIHDSLKRVKVYFAASDQPWPPKPNVILDAVENDLKAGWTFYFHLHNHYEQKSNNYLGILAPSITDAQYYSFLSEEFNLKNVLITNGIHTVEIKKEELKMLKSP